MGRPVVLSNGQLFVGLDENGLVHDFYYPYVGLENLTNARNLHHKIGVWVDGQFNWTDDGNWQIDVNFEADALISDVRMRSRDLGISLLFQDFIDTDYNALVRHVTITNEAETERDVRIFMHQVFQISRAGRADTAIYVPDGHYILNYKGRYCLLIAGKLSDGTDFDQYAIGNFRIEGKAGTYLDAEDGELSGNPVEHGGIDSVIRFKQHLKPGTKAELDYWIVAGSSQSEAERCHSEFKKQQVSGRLRHVRQNWLGWLEDAGDNLSDGHKLALRHSALIIKAHCDDRGSVLASGDSSIFNYNRDYYCYCWPRDAAYAVWPLIRLRRFDEARQFFEFARDVRHPDGYLMHKYQPDRAIGSTWHPLVRDGRPELAVQEDETASVVFMIGEYFEANNNDSDFMHELFRSFVKPAADWMASFVDEQTGLPHASYDLWEQKFLTTTYTTCTVISGLQTASNLAKAFGDHDSAARWGQTADNIRQGLDKLYHPDGYFRKGFLLQPDGRLDYDDTVDISSLYGPFMYAGLSLHDERLAGTLQRVEERLLNKSPSGGVPRYEHDGYFLTKPEYLGNPWTVSTLWLAQYYSTAGRIEDAQRLLDWALARQLPSGALSEQFDAETAEPLGVTPLVWSQAELINTLLDLNKT